MTAPQHVPAGAAGSGYVGGDPTTLGAASAQLTRAASSVQSVVGPFAAATGAAVEAAGAPAAYVALARLRSAWGGGLDELTGQVRAIGVVVDAAAADLAAAGGR